MRHFDFDEEPDIDYEPERPLMYCNCCEEEVRAVQVDHGIGSYEYWGSKGVHHDWRWCCPTCGEELE